MRVRQIWDFCDKVWVKIGFDSRFVDGVIIGRSKTKYVDVLRLNARRYALFLVKLKEQNAETRETLLLTMARLSGGSFVNDGVMAIMTDDKIYIGEVVKEINV